MTGTQGVDLIRNELKPWGAILLVLLLTHGVGLANGFTADDDNTILNHPAVGKGGGFEQLFVVDAIGTPLGAGASIYRPVTTLSYMVDQALGGGSPFPFHLTNLLLFLATCIALYQLALRWMPRMAALAAALFFTAAPIHVEAVANATGRSEVLALLLSLLALHAALPHAADHPWTEGPNAKRRLPAWAPALLAPLLYLAAILSKESAFPLFAIAGWITYLETRSLDDQQAWRLRAYLPALCMAMVGGIYLWFRSVYLSLEGVVPVDADNLLRMASVSPLAHIWTCLEILGRYVLLTFVPLNLSPDYSYAAIVPDLDLTNPLAWTGAATVGLTVIAAVHGLRRPSRASLVAGGFICSYFLVSNLVVLIGTIQAERLFFGPSLWVALAVGLAWQRLEGLARRAVRLGLAAAVLIAFVISGALASTHWRNNNTHGIFAVEAQPSSVRAQLWAANAHVRMGHPYQAIWHYALAGLGRVAYPKPWRHPNLEAEALPAKARVRDLPCLLRLPETRRPWARGLQRFLLRRDARAEAEVLGRHLAHTWWRKPCRTP